MPDPGFATFAALVAAAFAAGFVDAIAGGGGLITVPALVLAGFDPVSAVATNKLQSSFGSGTAALAFARAGALDWRRVWPMAFLSAAGALAGASLLTVVPRAFAAVALPPVLVLVAAYFAFSPRLRDADAVQRLPLPVFAVTYVPLIGAYDGLFGPGAGSLFMMGFVGLLGFGLLRAAAHAKLVNFASNLAGLGLLALSGHIAWAVGFAMAIGQVAGARLGALATIRSGGLLVRPVVVAVCCVLALRLALDPANPWSAWLALR